MRNTLVFALLVLFFLPACKDSKTTSKEKIADDAMKGTTESKPDQVKPDQVKPDQVKPEQPEPYQGNDPGEFSITAPKGWTRIDTVITGSPIVFIKSPREGATDNFIENVNVITEKIGNVGMDEYLSRSITNLEKGLNGYEQEKVSDRSINGLEFKSLRYSHRYSGTPIDVAAYFTIHSGTAYILTCSAKGGDIARWESEFDEIIRSFKLN